ncbi:hypothetical protein EV360DRAFT_79372 [Lentinula raphanica]|nr:hypothetical protein EV360DRAFT_79372 [Lentinula raphanica]
MSERHDLPYRPFSTLPVDVHSIILLTGQAIERLSALEDSEDEEEENTLSPFEVRASHVSQHWRMVALETAQLWNKIEIQPLYSPKKAEVYLARSKRSLLDIQLRDCPDTIPTQKIVDMLCQHSARWRICLIEAKLDSLLMTQIVRLATPSLEKLAISIVPPERSIRSEENWDGRPVLNGGSPRLKVVSLHEFALYYTRPTLSSVTHLELDYGGRIPLDHRELREILSSIPLIKNLAINGEINDALPREDHERIKLPRLLRLRISSLEGQVYSGILLTINAPLLEILVLDGVQDSDLDPFLESPYELLHLRSVSLRGSAFTPSKLNKVYTSFPSLKEVEMVDLVFNPSETIRVVSEVMREMGIVPLRLAQPTLLTDTGPKPKTLAHMLDAGHDQFQILQGRLQEKLIEDDIVDLDNSTWSFARFFNWLQSFVTADILLLATTKDI